MITTNKKSFEEAMLQRGYSLDELRGCIVGEAGGLITVDEKHPSYPRRPKPGLGDMTAAALSRIGITKERVSAALGRPCNCPKRQEFLNKLGRKFGIGAPD